MKNINKHKFRKNSRYYTIGIYTVVVVTICAIIIKMINNCGPVMKGFSEIMTLLSPFLMGFFIAYIINPMVKFLDGKIFKKLFDGKARRARKALSIIISYIIVISIITLVLVYIVPQLLDSLTAVRDFANTAQKGYLSIITFLKSLESEYPQIDLSSAIKFVEGIPELIQKSVNDMLPKLASLAYDTSMSVITGIINIFIAIVTSVYMLTDKTQIINRSKKSLYALFSRKRADGILSLVSECNMIFSNFIVGKMIDSLIIGILCFIVLAIIGIPYGLVISVIVGVTNMIPYFGPFIGAVPGVLLLLIVDIKYAAIFIVVIFILQQFDGLFLGPKILGESTGLKPLWIIFAISVGGYVAGVMGMFLGVPTVAVISNMTGKYLDKRLKNKNIAFVTNGETGIVSAADVADAENVENVENREEPGDAGDNPESAGI